MVTGPCSIFRQMGPNSPVSTGPLERSGGRRCMTRQISSGVASMSNE